MGKPAEYRCSRCGREVERNLLLAKKVLFVEMGEGGRTQRARVLDWLCPTCVAADFDWNRLAFQPLIQSGVQNG